MDVALIIGLTFTGLAVVFTALIILIFCMWVMGAIMKRVTGKQTKSPAQAPKAPAAPQAPAPVVEEGVTGETVAVISAALAAMLGSDRPVAIRSIKRAKDSRPAWNMAGVTENTRPF